MLLPSCISLLLVVLLLEVSPTRGCYPTGTPKPLVYIDKTTYFCLIINDRYVMVTQPTADKYTRIVIRGSWNSTKPIQGVAPTEYPCAVDTFWYPQGCPNTWTQDVPGGIPAKNYIGGPPPHELLFLLDRKEREL